MFYNKRNWNIIFKSGKLLKHKIVWINYTEIKSNKQKCSSEHLINQLMMEKDKTTRTIWLVRNLDKYYLIVEMLWKQKSLYLNKHNLNEMVFFYNSTKYSSLVDQCWD